MKEAGIPRRELVWLALAVALSLVVHEIFAIKGFGESDAARLAFQAAVWAKTVELPAIGYNVRTSPLYIHSLKATVQAGMPIAALPGLMCYMNVVLGSLALIPMYLLWRKLASAKVATLGLVVYSFMPAFWLGNIYGMPHLPAFFFFLCGLWCFSEAVAMSGRQAAKWFVASTLIAAIGIGLKADIVLCYGAFLWFALWARPVRLHNAVLACMVPVAGVLAAMCHTKLIAPPYVSAAEWNESFPFTIKAITDVENFGVLVMASGIVLSLAIAFSTVYCIVRKKHFGILSLAVFWSAPLILFWGLKMGNSTRHMMAGYAPLALIVAAVMIGCLQNRRVLAIAIIGLLVANYFISPSFSLPRTGRPSSRLFESQRHIQARVDSWHDAGKAFALLPDEQKVLYGQDYVIYAMWETLKHAKSFTSDKAGWAVVGDTGRQRVMFVYVPANQSPPPAEPGWKAYLWKDDGLRSSIAEMARPAVP